MRQLNLLVCLGPSVVISHGHRLVCFITKPLLPDLADTHTHTHCIWSYTDCIQDGIIRQLLPPTDGGWRFKQGAALLNSAVGPQLMDLPVNVPTSTHTQIHFWSLCHCVWIIFACCCTLSPHSVPCYQYVWQTHLSSRSIYESSQSFSLHVTASGVL